MRQSVWRIATDTPDYEADDLSGAGAKATGGRWNAIGTPLVYSSSNIALSALETLVHLRAGSLPLNRYLVRIDIPDDIYSAAENLGAGSAPVGWDALPAGRASIAYGSDWVASKRSACLIVPSLIVPEERNILINPTHPDAGRLSATKIRKWLYDARLR